MYVIIKLQSQRVLLPLKSRIILVVVFVVVVVVLVVVAIVLVVDVYRETARECLPS